MPRARNGRFTAERTTETTTRSVTERLTVSEPAAPARPGDPSPVFTSLLASAQWDPGFAAYLAGRPEPAVLPPAVEFGAAEFDTAVPASAPPVPAAVAVIQVPRTYRELEPATLDHDFTDAGR